MMLSNRLMHRLQALLLAVLASTPKAFCAEPSREIAKKEVTEHFQSLEEAKQRFSAPVPFKQWLDLVTFPGWQPLHSTETQAGYYALFRNGDCLIFCHRNRDDGPRQPAGQSSIQITAKEGGRSVWDRPPKWATIEYRYEYPGGALLEQSSIEAFKIKDDFQATLVLDFSRSAPEEAKEHSVYRQEVLWKQ